MRDEILLALVLKKIEESIPEISASMRGPRGFAGIPGEPGIDGRNGIDGRDGRDGINGRDGKDGRGFVWEEHADKIQEIIDQAALTFDKLTDEQVQSLKGRDGKDGRDGRYFFFEDYEPEFLEKLSTFVDEKSDQFKLKFSDLSEEERESLRGQDGKDFNFEEHREYFETLRPKFSDFTDQEKEEIRGFRGPRGQRGRAGEDGKNGKDGIQGLPGVSGRNGRDGRDGKDGVNGQDAPVIESIDVVQDDTKSFELDFSLSDGTKIRTRPVELPKQSVSQVLIPLVSSGGGGGGGADVEGFWLKSMTAYDKTLGVTYADSGLRSERISQVDLASSTVPDANATMTVTWLGAGTMNQRISEVELSGVWFLTETLKKVFNYSFDGFKYRLEGYSYTLD